MLRIDNTPKLYMQTKSFWNDPHNKLMSEISEKLIEQRDYLSYVSKQNSKDYFQSVDVFVVKKNTKNKILDIFKDPFGYPKGYFDSLNKKYDVLKEELREQANIARYKHEYNV